MDRGMFGGGGGSEDPVVATINAKVLQEFIPRVPEIVTFIETHYGMNTNNARDFLQSKVAHVLAALHAPLLAERRTRQNRIEALKEEVSYVRGEVTKSSDAANALKNDLNRVQRERERAKVEVADLKRRDGGHSERLKKLLRAFGSSTDTVTPWEDVDSKVTELLARRKEHETLKRQHDALKKRMVAKAAEAATSAQSVNSTAAEQFARLSAELSERREEFASYRTIAENKIADLMRSVKEKSEAVKRLEQKNATTEKRMSSSVARNTEETDRLARSLAESQATVAEITEELRGKELQLASEENHHSNMSVQHYAHIDELNTKVNDLSSKLSEAVQANETAKARFDEYSAIKALYERVSASLESARVHFGRDAAIDYNEPVTKILLDVLDKVQAHDTDFSTLKVPSCAATRVTPNLVDAQNQTSEQLPPRTVYLMADVDPTNVSLPPSALVCRPEDSINALLSDADWPMDATHTDLISFHDSEPIEPILTAAAGEFVDSVTAPYESADAHYSALVTALGDDITMESFTVAYSSSSAPLDQPVTDGGEYYATAAPPLDVPAIDEYYSTTAAPLDRPVTDEYYGTAAAPLDRPVPDEYYGATAAPIDRPVPDEYYDAAAAPAEQIPTDGGEYSGTAVVTAAGENSATAAVPVNGSASDGYEAACVYAVHKIAFHDYGTTRNAGEGGGKAKRRNATDGGRPTATASQKRQKSADGGRKAVGRNVNDVSRESNVVRGNGPASRKRVGDDSVTRTTPEPKRKRRSRRPDQERSGDTLVRTDLGTATGGESKIRHAKSRDDGGAKIGHDIGGSETAVLTDDGRTGSSELPLSADPQLQKLFAAVTETGSTPSTEMRVDAATTSADAADKTRPDVFSTLFKRTEKSGPKGPGRFPMLSLEDDLDFDECELRGERTYVEGTDSFCAISIHERSKDPDIEELNRLLNE